MTFWQRLKLIWSAPERLGMAHANQVVFERQIIDIAQCVGNQAAALKMLAECVADDFEQAADIVERMERRTH
jgi:hypothetical protein